MAFNEITLVASRIEKGEGSSALPPTTLWKYSLKLHISSLEFLSQSQPMAYRVFPMAVFRTFSKSLFSKFASSHMSYLERMIPRSTPVWIKETHPTLARHPRKRLDARQCTSTIWLLVSVVPARWSLVLLLFSGSGQRKEAILVSKRG